MNWESEHFYDNDEWHKYDTNLRLCSCGGKYTAEGYKLHLKFGQHNDKMNRRAPIAS